jgi:hypothetical protein
LVQVETEQTDSAAEAAEAAVDLALVLAEMEETE